MTKNVAPRSDQPMNHWAVVSGPDVIEKLRVVWPHLKQELFHPDDFARAWYGSHARQNGRIRELLMSTTFYGWLDQQGDRGGPYRISDLGKGVVHHPDLQPEGFAASLAARLEQAYHGIDGQAWTNVVTLENLLDFRHTKQARRRAEACVATQPLLDAARRGSAALLQELEHPTKVNLPRQDAIKRAPKAHRDARGVAASPEFLASPPPPPPPEPPEPPPPLPTRSGTINNFYGPIYGLQIRGENTDES